MQCLHIPVHPVWAEWIINPIAQSFAQKADAYLTKPPPIAGALLLVNVLIGIAMIKGWIKKGRHFFRRLFSGGKAGSNHDDFFDNPYAIW